MSTLLYIHGFLSSPRSQKAEQIREYCLQHYSHYQFVCPQLTPYPEKTAQQLKKIVLDAEKPVYIVGSSMGGFWATWLSEIYGCKSVLINPAVDVCNLMPPFLNTPLKNYHSNDTYFLTQNHLLELSSYEVSELGNKKNFWVLLQTGDETLDYQLAVEKYSGCQQTVEQGGNHSFEGVDRFFTEFFTFFEKD